MTGTTWLPLLQQSLELAHLSVRGRVRSRIKPAGVRHAKGGRADDLEDFLSIQRKAWYRCRRTGVEREAQADKAPSDLSGISRAVPSNGVVRQKATIHDYGKPVRPKKLTDKGSIVPPLTILGQHLPVGFRDLSVPCNIVPIGTGFKKADNPWPKCPRRRPNRGQKCLKAWWVTLYRSAYPVG